MGWTGKLMAKDVHGDCLKCVELKGSVGEGDWKNGVAEEDGKLLC